MRFQELQKTIIHSDQQGSHLKHLGHSRLSGLQPGRVVVVTSSFSDSIVFAVHTRKTAFSKQYRFKNVPLWRAFSKRSVFADRFRCCVDGSCIRNKTVSFSFENGTVWTGSYTVDALLLTSEH